MTNIKTFFLSTASARYEKIWSRAVFLLSEMLLSECFLIRRRAGINVIVTIRAADTPMLEKRAKCFKGIIGLVARDPKPITVVSPASIIGFPTLRIDS